MKTDNGRNTAFQRIMDAQETNKGFVNLTIRQPSHRYLDEFVGLKCAPDLLALGLYPNAKEITESIGGYRAAKALVGSNLLSSPDVTAICVGDGSTPRTAAMIAFRSNWQVISIDPQLRDKPWDIRRLRCIPDRVENVLPDIVKTRIAVIVAVHSHAPVEPTLAVATRAIMIHYAAIPCCEDLRVLGLTPEFDFDDWRILSPQRRVIGYADVARAWEPARGFFQNGGHFKPGPCLVGV